MDHKLDTVKITIWYGDHISSETIYSRQDIIMRTQEMLMDLRFVIPAYAQIFDILDKKELFVLRLKNKELANSVQDMCKLSKELCEKVLEFGNFLDAKIGATGPEHALKTQMVWYDSKGDCDGKTKDRT